MTLGVVTLETGQPNQTKTEVLDRGAASLDAWEADTERAAAEIRLSAAMFRLCGTHPYLAAALWAMTRVAAPGISTLGVDVAWRLYYDPAAVARWTMPELTAVVYHEVSHLLRDHAGRRPVETDPLAWNVCADAEINDGLRDEGQPLPEEPIFPSTLGAPDGLLAEQYLPFLAKSGQSGQSADGEDLPQPGPCRGCCGSGAGGFPGGWEINNADGTAAGIVLAEAELVRRQTAHAIEEHVRARGTVPGNWQRWAQERLEPKVDWRRELAALVRHSLADVSGATDYSYRRPSRRQTCLGAVIAPSLRHSVPRVAIIVDTSGSVTSELLDRALAEVAGILQAAGQREGVTVLAVDAAVQSSQCVFRADRLSLAGGGGTDMGVGLAAVCSLRPRPDIVVVITDGFTPWPQVPPHGLRTVVVLTGDGSAPAWAKAIHIPRLQQ